MEVIIDTNVIADAIFFQIENEDCWEVLHLVRKGDVIPVLCEALFREYMFVPMKITFDGLLRKLQSKQLTDSDFHNARQASYECSSIISKIFINSAKFVKVTSTQRISPDSDDDKIINLAIDSNCTAIITKNISHFECVNDKHIRTRSGKDIIVYNPEQFIRYNKLIKYFHEKQA